MGRFRAAPVSTAVVLCTACAGGAGEPLACTEIGAEPGVSITISETMAAEMEDPVLEVCAAECHTYPVDLFQGTEAVDLGCDSAEPEGSCSASMRPDGTLVGFVRVDELTAGEVGVTLISGDQHYRSTGTPQLVYPNGRNCPGEALQLSVTLDDGRLATRS
ncbi:hypothetical protein [Arthrobacter subterraneus]|uniref:hypothetical protein n=1 Tax=Arthrobacter subterraneus TaxID=335973 RepID=UPI003822ACFA